MLTRTLALPESTNSLMRIHSSSTLSTTAGSCATILFSASTDRMGHTTRVPISACENDFWNSEPAFRRLVSRNVAMARCSAPTLKLPRKSYKALAMMESLSPQRYEMKTS